MQKIKGNDKGASPRNLNTAIVFSREAASAGRIAVAASRLTFRFIFVLRAYALVITHKLVVFFVCKA